MSGEVSVAVLDERTKTIGKNLDDHIKEDDKRFGSVFKLIRDIEIAQAKSGVIIGAVVIVAQVVIGAWVKGLF